MGLKTERMEARISADERAPIERAAALAGMSVSAFLVASAVARADDVITAATTTLVPADCSDELVAALDEPDAAPRRLARGAPDRIPAILLAKLALDPSVQGRGLGSELLVVALGIIVAAAKRAGGRIVLVDDVSDDARDFYERYDVELLPDQSHRLAMKLGSVARALEVPWP